MRELLEETLNRGTDVQYVEQVGENHYLVRFFGAGTVLLKVEEEF